MKAFFRTAPLAAALCLAAAPLFAADGILIVEKTTTNGATSRTNQVQIEKTRMRAESDRGGQTQVMVFDGTAQVMRIINPEKKTYSEITKADVDRLAGQMNAAMAQMQEQLKNVPEAQRAQIEAMMRGRGLAVGAPAQTEYRKTGTDKVGKWTCDKYEGYENNQKVSELCTVDPKALGFTAADFEVSKQMASFFSAIVPQGGAQFLSLGNADAKGYSGVPIRRTFSIAGVQMTSELMDVTRQNFPEAVYAVPAGFTKEDSPFAAAGGRGRGRGRQ